MTVKEKQSVEAAVTGGLKTVFAVAESYPDLKASQSFIDLHKNLVAIENDIQYARRYYNGSARNWNVLVESFPSNIVASAFGFKQVEYFEIELATQRASVEVTFDSNKDGK